MTTLSNAPSVTPQYSPIYIPQQTNSYTNSTGFADSIHCGMQEVPPVADLSQVVNAAYADTVAQQKVNAFDLKCCPQSPERPCSEEIYFRFKNKGCGVSYSDNITSCEVSPLGDRYWVADNNPILYERSIAQNAEQSEYMNFNARQGLWQFLWVDKIREPIRDPYSRPLHGGNLKNAYCAQLQINGPSKYTNF